MKKLFYFPLLAFIFFSITSCSIDSDIVLHKDKTTSTVMNVDMRVFFAIMKDSAFASSSKKSESFEKFPKTWTSYYDLRLKESKKAIPKDSAQLYKKMFVKSNMENNEMVGFSMKFDRFSEADYAMFNSREENNLPITTNAFTKWDGKTLKINTNEFVNKDLREMVDMLAGKNDAGTAKITKSKESPADEKLMNFSTTLRFETPIKSMIGKHPWVKKIDDKTIQIKYSADDVMKASEKVLKGGEIIITAE